jgi:hypothetical protein
MAKKRRRRARFPRVDIDKVRRFNRLIPDRMSQTISARSDQLCIAVLRAFLGQEWIERHVESTRPGFLNMSGQTLDGRERRVMRRVALAEMLFNLQNIPGFDSCLEKLAAGDIEATYAVFDITRVVMTLPSIRR